MLADPANVVLSNLEYAFVSWVIPDKLNGAFPKLDHDVLYFPLTIYNIHDKYHAKPRDSSYDTNNFYYKYLRILIS